MISVFATEQDSRETTPQYCSISKSCSVQQVNNINEHYVDVKCNRAWKLKSNVRHVQK